MSDQPARIAAVLAEIARRKDFYKFERYFLDDGPFRRELKLHGGQSPGSARRSRPRLDGGGARAARHASLD